MMNRFTFSVLVCLLFLSTSLFAQNRIVNGTVTDATGSKIPGVTVQIKGTNKGTSTDMDGKYTITTNSDVVLAFSAIGFAGQEIKVGNQLTINVTLLNDEKVLNEVVVVGSRASQRSLTDSPLPIDILSSADLQSTGQPTFDKALQYRVPSFNTVNTPVNDALPYLTLGNFVIWDQVVV
jgi:iron complex outermembrane receptor protein